jgi:hypothetical protein
VARVGGKGDSKGNKVMMRDLEGVAVKLVGEQPLVKKRSSVLPAL